VLADSIPVQKLHTNKFPRNVALQLITKNKKEKLTVLPYDFLTKRIIDALPSCTLVLRLTTMRKPDYYRIQAATSYALSLPPSLPSLPKIQIAAIFSPTLTHNTMHRAGKRKPPFPILITLDIIFPILQG